MTPVSGAGIIRDVGFFDRLIESGAGPELILLAAFGGALIYISGRALNGFVKSHVTLATAYRELAVAMAEQTKAIERLAENQNAVIAAVLKEGRRNE